MPETPSETAATKRGRFIVIEGLDRAGKSTQVDQLAQRLDAKVWKFPDRTTPTGQIIDTYLRSQTELDDNAVHLIFSANRWEAMRAIKNVLLQGKDIVCDRYAFSGVAYSHAKGLPYAWCRSADVGLLVPDQIIFLDLSPDKAKERGGYGEERYEKEELQRKVRECFRAIEQDVNASSGGSANWATIDAGRSVEEVESDIWEALQRGDTSSRNLDLDMSLFIHEPPESK